MQSLHNCYRKHNVDFAQELCEAKHAKNGTRLLQCFAEKGVPKNIRYCELVFKEDAELEERLECLGHLGTPTIEVCDLRGEHLK